MAIAVAVGYMVGSAITFSRYHEPHTCQQVHWTIEDWGERKYVTIEELERVLRTNAIYPKTLQRDDIQTQKIESTLQNHPMIRTAECYVSEEGEVFITLTQRQPILRVITGAESYLVDSDRRRMSVRETIKDHLLLAEGNIGERMATHELAEFALWLQSNPYWRERITTVRVRTPHYMELIQTGGEPRIVVDGLSKVEKQLAKLRKYNEGMANLNEKPAYHELDIRFEGQVVGRK